LTGPRRAGAGREGSRRTRAVPGAAGGGAAHDACGARVAMTGHAGGAAGPAGEAVLEEPQGLREEPQGRHGRAGGAAGPAPEASRRSRRAWLRPCGSGPAVRLRPCTPPPPPPHCSPARSSLGSGPPPRRLPTAAARACVRRSVRAGVICDCWRRCLPGADDPTAGRGEGVRRAGASRSRPSKAFALHSRPWSPPAKVSAAPRGPARLACTDWHAAAESESWFEVRSWSRSWSRS
jgi:hypothetical protein